MTQGQQQVLIVNEDLWSENLTASSTGDILKTVDDDRNEEQHWPKISDLSAQRVEGKW